MPITCPRCKGSGSIESHNEMSPYTAKVLDLLMEQFKVMKERGALYEDSWKSEGPDGLMYNILRKLRRLWKVLMLDGKQPNPDDGIDLANYSLMLIALTQVDPQSVSHMKVRGTKELFGGLAPDAMAPGGKLREGRPNA